MTDAMQTIRGYVQEAHDYMQDGMSSYKWQQAYGFICKTLAALTDLDSLAVAPSEDAREEALQFAESIHEAVDYDDVDDFSGRVINIYDDCVLLIQARDERIRRETLEAVFSKIASARHEDVFSAEADWAYNEACKDIVAILKPEATDGQ